MKARYKHLLENSISAILSAIEIYNKPDFRYRNEIFVILAVNAWELILKSKILKDNNGKTSSLYIKKANGRFVETRNKTKMTISINDAMNRTSLDTNLKRNLEEFIKIRDNAIHFYNKDNLNYLIFSLGVANLRNYQKLVKQWYDKDLLEYNFYILPLGFAHNFKGYSLLELKKEPQIIRDLIKTVQYYQDNPKKSEFDFTCEIEVNLKSAKKITEKTDAKIEITKEGEKEGTLFYQTKKLIDKYPLTYTDLKTKLRKDYPNFNQNDLSKLIKEHKIKGNEKYSTYLFTSKSKEEEYKKTGIVPKAIKVIYNHDCYKFLKSLLNKK